VPRPTALRVEESADRRLHEPLVTQAAQERQLAAARFRPAGRHVRCLVPTQQRLGAAQIADFPEALLQLGEFGLMGHR
jgi:hypothetical protein